MKNEKIKILFCSTGFENQVEGPSVFLQNLYQMLQKGSIRKEIDLQILTEDVSQDSDIIHKVDVYLTWPFNKLSMLSRAWFYYKELKKLKHRYHFSHLVFSDPIPASLSIWKRQAGTKIICFVNDDDNLFPNKQRVFSKKLVRLLYQFIQKKVLQKTDLVITNSNYLDNLLKNRYALKTGILRKGVKLEEFEFTPALPIDLSRPIRILFIKKDFVRGGLYILLKAINMLSSLDVMLTIVGPSELAGRAIKTKFESDSFSIRIFENMSRKEVVSQMKSHHIFCVPSLREALGVANLEALASGLPVVSTTAGGIPEATKNGEVAWLCKPGNAQALKNTLLLCLHNEKERERKVITGRKWVEENYDFKQVSANFFNLIGANQSGICQ